MVRDGWRLEALEPRVLLSADPVLGAIQSVVTDDRGHDQALHGAYDFDHPAPTSAEPLLSRESYDNLINQPVHASVPATVFDVGDLQAQGFSASTLTVAANETLRGSGTLNVAVLNTGLVSPGHSPGVDNVSSYTQSAGGTLTPDTGARTAR
ncbi:hypothetical protein NS331_24610, partial [Pseudacidovorax intermedius]